jgi:hypothetical protein
MSTETLKMCDVQNCGKVAQHTLEYVTVGVWDIKQERKSPAVKATFRAEDGLHIWTSVGVDRQAFSEDYTCNIMPYISKKLEQELKSTNQLKREDK